MPLRVLKKAINLRRTILFDYNGQGERIGNPHIIYINRDKKGIESTKVEVEQIGGYSSSSSSFPGYRAFDLDKITDVRLTDNESKFIISDKFKPQNGRYIFIIEKV